jgi:ribosomal protein S18 acetylase RimI-like enzyme
MHAAGLRFREATLEDAQAIAAFHLGMWLHAYAPFAPAEAIATLNGDMRLRRWTEVLSKPNHTLVLQDGDTIIALGHCGAPSHDAFQGRGEIKHIFVSPAFARRGIGQRLFQDMAGILLSDGYNAIGLGVLMENAAAIRFYDALGGRVIGSYVDAGPIWRSRNLAYVWDNAQAIAGNSP